MGKFVSLSFTRSKETLREPLDDLTKGRYIKEFRPLMRIASAEYNRLLLRAAIKAFLPDAGERYDAFAVRLALQKTNERYLEEGWYGDFPGCGSFADHRMGAFNTLALSNWKYGLHEDLSYGRARNMLTSVMKRMF